MTKGPRGDRLKERKERQWRGGSGQEGRKEGWREGGRAGGREERKRAVSEKKSNGSQTIEGQRITQRHSCRFLGPSPENQTLYVWGRDMQSKENAIPPFIDA